MQMLVRNERDGLLRSRRYDTESDIESDSETEEEIKAPEKVQINFKPIIVISIVLTLFLLAGIYAADIDTSLLLSSSISRIAIPNKKKVNSYIELISTDANSITLNFNIDLLSTETIDTNYGFQCTLLNKIYKLDETIPKFYISYTSLSETRLVSDFIVYFADKNSYIGGNNLKDKNFIPNSISKWQKSWEVLGHKDFCYSDQQMLSLSEGFSEICFGYPCDPIATNNDHNLCKSGIYSGLLRLEGYGTTSKSITSMTKPSKTKQCVLPGVIASPTISPTIVTAISPTMKPSPKKLKKTKVPTFSNIQSSKQPTIKRSKTKKPTIKQ